MNLGMYQSVRDLYSHNSWKSPMQKICEDMKNVTYPFAEMPMVVVCGKEVTGTMNTEISMADRLHIICTTLDGLVQIKESK